MIESDRDQAIVYRFFDAADRLLYIGLTSVGVARFAQHAIDQPWWRDVVRIAVQHFDSLDDAIVAERLAILAEQPLHNVIHRDPQARRRRSGRRPPRQGSVYQRRDGLWVAQRSRGPRGQRQTVRRYAHTKWQAFELLAQLQVMPDAELFLEPLDSPRGVTEPSHHGESR